MTIRMNGHVLEPAPALYDFFCIVCDRGYYDDQIDHGMITCGFGTEAKPARRIYLAGPINGCSDSECKDWRTEAKSKLSGNEFLDPMDRDYRGKEDSNAQHIVDKDKADIRNSSLVLAYCPKPSVGTSMEVLYASLVGVTVVVVAPEPVSPWLRAHSQYIAPDLDSAIEYISKESTWL